MAVYEQSYRPYAGPRTPENGRFLVIPRYAFRNVFQGKLLTAFFVLCFIPVLVAAIMIYLKHNVSALTILQASVGDLLPIDADFFYTFLAAQGSLAFFLTVLVGPPLVAQDLNNNALSLYLARPFSRAEYLAGKASVLVFLLSVITWVPGLLLFALQAYLDGGAWFKANYWVAGAIFGGSALLLTVLTLLALAISAALRWRTVASGALVALALIPLALGNIINEIFQTRWGHLISLRDLIRAVWGYLFRNFVTETVFLETRPTGGPGDALTEPPVWISFAILVLLCAFCVWWLRRRVRAYEVVS